MEQKGQFPYYLLVPPTNFLYYYLVFVRCICYYNYGANTDTLLVTKIHTCGEIHLLHWTSYGF